MKNCCLLISVALLLGSCASRKEKTEAATVSTVFESGWQGYSHFRIPSLLKSERYLFAFAEGRKNSVRDHGDISIVLRRSEDGGKSWGDLIKVAEVAGESMQNPVAVYVEEMHKIVLLFTKRTVGEDTENMIRKGTSVGYVGVFQLESRDDGLTWSAIREITPSVKKDNWRWYALGPGGGIRLQYNSAHRGRIVIPANHSTDGGAENDYLGAHALYSDDGGQTWQIGGVDSVGESTVNPNETTVVELKDGSLYFNTRNHSSVDTIANRAVTYSRDAGATFSGKFTHEKQLNTPVVHASITRNKKELFFLAPFDKKERKDLSLWRSKDEGAHWTYDRLLYQGPSAYSSVVTLDQRRLGALIEVDSYGRIIYQSIRVR